MRRHRLLVLSSIAIISSGALVFACGGGDDTDGGIDSSAADSTTKDAATDTTTNKDTSTSDVANDTSSNDASDAGDAQSMDGGPSDAGGATTFMVVRAGGVVDAGSDASLAGGTSQPVFVEERNVSDGSLVRTIVIPTAVTGSNFPCTITGSATSEGALTTSEDGKYVVFGGYGAPPGVPTIVDAAVGDGGTQRIVARIDSSGNVDTTTELESYSQGNIRGVATDDGGQFWTSGVGLADAAAQGGAMFVALSSTGAFTNVAGNPSNMRTIGIFGGQLYATSALPTFVGVATIGTNLPTTAGQSYTLLSGFAGDAGSPYGFSLLDLDASVTGVDTLYIADDSSQAKGGGIQKWVNTGSTWTKITTFTNGTSSGFRGVTAIVSGSDVIVIGTDAASSTNSIIKYVDDGVNLAPTGTVLSTAATGTIYRGIAIAPH